MNIILFHKFIKFELKVLMIFNMKDLIYNKKNIIIWKKLERYIRASLMQ